MESSKKEILLTIYLVLTAAVVIILYSTLDCSTLNIKVTSTSLPGEKIDETLTIETESGTNEYKIATNVQSEVNKKTEKSLPAEEAIDYVQQHQQQFGKEEADRITGIIAEISTRKRLNAEEAIDYVQQHQQQFGKEEADRITEIIAEISTRNQKIRWIRICVPVILVIIAAVAYIKTYFLDSDSDDL